MKEMQPGRGNILRFTGLYDEKFSGKSEGLVEEELRDWFAGHRYLNKVTFLKLGMWKSTRPKRFYESNSEKSIVEVTKAAIVSNDEFYKITSLQVLSGVSWPVASVILHFAEPDKYTIMDFRAIWSLGMAQPKSYNFDFWMKYTETVRGMAERAGVDLRTLDKALWMYSKLNQR